MIWELVKALNGRAPEIRLPAAGGGDPIAIRRMTYTDAVFGSSPPAGVVIFGDIEHLLPVEQPHVARLWHRLAASRGAARPLNHPLRAMRRYELLRVLRERAINDFDAYSLLEARKPSRYPVYLTREAGANELPIELLDGPADVDAEIGKLISLGLGRDGRLVIEFTATPDPRGYYRRHFAFGLDGRVVPYDLRISTDWRAEDSDPGLDAALELERQAFVAARLDDGPLPQIFRMASIDIGVVEYVIDDGRPQVLGIRPGLPHRLDGFDASRDGAEGPTGRDRCLAALRALAASIAGHGR